MQEFHDSTPDDVARYPMVPIRDVVVFPYTKAAFVIGRPASVRALEEALAIMAQSYDRLGLAVPRDDALKVLRHNFPNSPYLAGAQVKPGKSWWKFW